MECWEAEQDQLGCTSMGSGFIIALILLPFLPVV